MSRVALTPRLTIFYSTYIPICVQFKFYAAFSTEQSVSEVTEPVHRGWRVENRLCGQLEPTSMASRCHRLAQVSRYLGAPASALRHLIARYVRRTRIRTRVPITEW